MRFGVLGPLEVVADDGGRCDPSAGRQRRLLLALLVVRDGAVDVDRLADIVWGQDERLPEHPAGAVRTYIARLRRVLEPEGAGGEPSVLVGGPDRFQLVLDGHQLDAAALEAELEQATALVDEDVQAALEVVERGLGRWRGRPLAEVADEGWAQPDAVRLEELRLAAQELRVRCLLELGRHAEVLADLERTVREHPLRERPHGQLMVALHRCGRSGEATEVFRGLRDRLVEELGLDPSAELARMHQRLLQGDDPEGRATRVAASGMFNTLPEPRTPLVGRDEHLAGIVELAGSSRVVTLTGVGGVGKTRLALAIAHRIRQHDGQVVFVDLSVVTDASEVVDAVFAALRLPAAARRDQLDGLVRVLRSQPVLLVLDNCEHVLDAVATLIDRVTRDCPELTVLATSREAIDIDGEHTYHVPSLELAGGVQLFTSRATAAAGGETATEDRDAVAEICRRLDGIPLAIELAAARTSHLTPAAIAERLDDRFWLLAGGRRALGRHQTLQATMDWSYDLLEDQEQAVLRAAAVFVGGFDATALAAVSGRSDRDILDRLAALVRSSLVEVDHTGGQPRYRLLETVRLYALDRLAEAGELADRRRAHAEHFLTRALTHPPRFDDLPEWGVSTEDDIDLDSHLAALDWFDRQDAHVEVGRLAARIPTVLRYTAFVDVVGRYLGRQDVVAALEDPDERALYLTASATNASYLGRFRDQLTFGQAAWEAASDPVVHAAATVVLANACTVFDPRRVPGLVDDALAKLPASAPLLRQELRGQLPLGLVMEGRLAEAADLLQEPTREGDRFCFTAAELMLVLHLLGEQQRALAVPRPSDLDPQGTLWDYRWSLVRALAAATECRFAAASQHLADAADQIRSSPIQLLDTDVLLGYAALAYHAGDHHRAAEILATFRGATRSPASHAVYLHYRELLKARLSKTERTQILERAADLDPADILEREVKRTPRPTIHSKADNLAATSLDPPWVRWRPHQTQGG